MSQFLIDAMSRAGLADVWTWRRAGDFAAIRQTVSTWRNADLLALGALADEVRRVDVGDVVRFVTEKNYAGFFGVRK